MNKTVNSHQNDTQILNQNPSTPTKRNIKKKGKETKSHLIAPNPAFIKTPHSAKKRIIQFIKLVYGGKFTIFPIYPGGSFIYMENFLNNLGGISKYLGDIRNYLGHKLEYSPRKSDLIPFAFFSVILASFFR